MSEQGGGGSGWTFLKILGVVFGLLGMVGFGLCSLCGFALGGHDSGVILLAVVGRRPRGAVPLAGDHHVPEGARGSRTRAVTAALAAALHGVFEWAGIFVGARIYLRTSHTSLAELGATRNYAIIFGCIVGAAIGNKAMHWLQRADQWNLLRENPWLFLQGQSIVGGLLGGSHRSRDREAVAWACANRPAIASSHPSWWGSSSAGWDARSPGLQDDTYGIPTTLPWGIDLGDGVPRHPTASSTKSLFAAGRAAAGASSLARALAREPGLRLQTHAGGLSRRGELSIDALKPVPYAYVGGLEWHPARLSALALRRLPAAGGAAIARGCAHDPQSPALPVLRHHELRCARTCLRVVEAKIVFKDAERLHGQVVSGARHASAC